MATTTASKPALRLPFAIAGALVALLMMVAQVIAAAVALRSHSAQAALQFVVMLPLTGIWCFCLIISGPASVRTALRPFARLCPGLGMSLLLTAMFAVFVMGYGFK